MISHEERKDEVECGKWLIVPPNPLSPPSIVRVLAGHTVAQLEPTFVYFSGSQACLRDLEQEMGSAHRRCAHLLGRLQIKDELLAMKKLSFPFSAEYNVEVTDTQLQPFKQKQCTEGR